MTTRTATAKRIFPDDRLSRNGALVAWTSAAATAIAGRYMWARIHGMVPPGRTFLIQPTRLRPGYRSPGPENARKVTMPSPTRNQSIVVLFGAMLAWM